MRRRDRDRLEHMLDAAREARALVAGRSRVDLDQERTLALALTRLLEIVGEAGNQLPRDVQALAPDIPWPDIVGMRNRLIHAYFHVNLDILWKTVAEDLPPLIEALQDVLKRTA